MNIIYASKDFKYIINQFLISHKNNNKLFNNCFQILSKLETNDIYSTYKQNLLTQMLSKQKNIYKKMHNCNSTNKIEYLLKYNNLNYNINKLKKKYKLQEGGSTIAIVGLSTISVIFITLSVGIFIINIIKNLLKTLKFLQKYQKYHHFLQKYHRYHKYHP